MAPRAEKFTLTNALSDKALRQDKPAPAGLRAEERRLAARARAGDPAALRSLLQRLSTPLYRFGRHFCRNEEDAQDVMQETLAAMVRTLPNWRGDSALSTWAYTVARNTCGRMRRRRAGAPQRLESLSDPAARSAARALGAPDADPASAFERRRLGEALEAALARLPAAQREVVVLRDVEGLSAPTVGKALGLGEAAVKSRLHRGRLALRRDLAAEHGGASARRPPGCPDTARLLSRHVEGELDAATCRRLSRHVEECSGCSAACASLRAALGACARFGREPIPAGTRDSIRRAIRAVVAAPAAAASPRAPRRRT